MGVGLAVLAGAFDLVGGPPAEGGRSLLWATEVLLARLGQCLPFGAFAAGVHSWTAAASGPRLGRRLLHAAAIGALAYLLGAVALPLAEFAYDAERGRAVETLRPFGPDTPAGMLERRRYAIENPPAQPSFSVNRPLERPAYHIDFLIHNTVAGSVFSILFALVGFLAERHVGDATGRGRRNRIWLLGLVTGAGFIFATLAASAAVRSLPSPPGALLAWLPLLVPITAAALLVRLHDRLRSNVP